MEEINWEKTKNVQNKPANQKVKNYYDMDEEVKYWSDYSNVKFTDRSYMLINQYDTATM